MCERVRSRSMRMEPRPLRPGALVVAGLAASAAIAVAVCATPASRAQGRSPHDRGPRPDDAADRAPAVIVVMRALRSDRGVASAGLYASASSWTHAGQEVATCHAPVVDRVSRCRLEDVPPGRYAIGVMHDEDGDGHFDTGFLGIPTEGYGFSRDARGTLGPPSFESAAFDYAGGVLEVPITMRYGI